MEAAEKLARQQLGLIYEPREANNIADLLLEKLTTFKRLDRITNTKVELDPATEKNLLQALSRLMAHEPIQYVINESWFYGMPLYVDNAVLIPRPETEELVAWVLEDMKLTHPDAFHLAPNTADQTRSLKILDIGTGSGCIALAIKKELQAAEVWGSDKSIEALTVARRNASALNIRVDFQEMDILIADQYKQMPTVHVLVSNPPYIPYQQKGEMDQHVVAHEPHMALFVPDDDPYLFYRHLAAFSKKRVYSSGRIYVEIHENLSEGVQAIFRDEGYEDITLRKDMQGKHRMIRIIT